MAPRTLLKTLTDLQEEQAAACPFFALRRNHSYSLPQENGNLAHQLPLSDCSEVSK